MGDGTPCPVTGTPQSPDSGEHRSTRAPVADSAFMHISLSAPRSAPLHRPRPPLSPHGSRVGHLSPTPAFLTLSPLTPRRPSTCRAGPGSRLRQSRVPLFYLFCACTHLTCKSFLFTHTFLKRVRSVFLIKFCPQCRFDWRFFSPSAASSCFAPAPPIGLLGRIRAASPILLQVTGLPSRGRPCRALPDHCLA
jgi:hypothetical protein